MKNLEEIKKMLSPIFKKYKIKRAIVFGSYAKGEESSRSDLDLVLIQDTDKRFFDRYEGIYSEILNKIGGELDLLIYTPNELEKIAHRKFIRHIIKEGKVIYESK